MKTPPLCRWLAPSLRSCGRRRSLLVVAWCAAGWIPTTSPSLRAQVAPATPAPPARPAIELSPFVVNTDKDQGFAAANAGTATRLALAMKDVPAAYSVMTREFIDALGITNVQDAASWASTSSPARPTGISRNPTASPSPRATASTPNPRVFV